jgi:hypothetical protein
MSSSSVHLPERVKPSGRFWRWFCGYLFTKAKRIAMFWLASTISAERSKGKKIQMEE